MKNYSPTQNRGTEFVSWQNITHGLKRIRHIVPSSYTIVPSVAAAADVFPVVMVAAVLITLILLTHFHPETQRRHWLEPFTSELQLAAARGCTTPSLQQGYGSPGPRHVAIMVPSHTQRGQHVIALPLLSTALLLPMYTFGKKCLATI